MRIATRPARGRGAHSSSERLAKGLGYFSLALGLAEAIAPGAVCRGLGLRGREDLVRAYGAREIATGMAILASHDPAPWIWGRIGGDAIDLATLASAMRDADEEERRSLSLAMVAVAGIAALDVACAWGLAGDKAIRSGFDYGDRRGFPRTPGAMRGAARDFRVPDDMRMPKALRPYGSGDEPTRARPSYM